MPSAASLLVAMVGFLWLVLWRERWRFAGVIPILLALPLAAATPHPDIIINADGTAAAARGGDGRLHVLGSDAFSVENWLRADGDARAVKDPTVTAGVACDRVGCVTAAASGAIVALVTRPEAFAEDCRRATIVLSRYDAPKGCAASGTVIDGRRLDQGGAHALFRDGPGYRLEAAYPTVRRPFMPPVRG